MTQIICQECEDAIEFVPDGKGKVLYGKCSNCSDENTDDNLLNEDK